MHQFATGFKAVFFHASRQTCIAYVLQAKTALPCRIQHLLVPLAFLDRILLLLVFAATVAAVGGTGTGAGTGTGRGFWSPLGPGLGP